jgi:hypothetical protein
VASNDPAVLAAVEDEFGGTTEEGDEDGAEIIAQGDAEGAADATETVAAPAPAAIFTPISAEAAPATPAAPITPAAETVAITSEYIPGVMSAFATDGDVLELSRP